MPVDDNWDWPFLLYLATVILNRPEKQFWRMTPRKLTALANVHAEVMKAESGESKPKEQKVTGYVDQLW